MAERSVRNLAQTYQERDIIKTAPDSVVYINNIPYIVNPYIGDKGVIVNFNDYITQISGVADTDSLIPSCTINLSVPIHNSSLFIAPGGNRIIATMSLVKIFGKGYFFDDDGNTVYYRTFYGIVDSVGYTHTKNSVEIVISCKGILRLYELIQTNIAPSTLNYGVYKGVDPQAFTSRDYRKNPLTIIQDNLMNFLKTVEVEAAFIPTNIQNASEPDSRVTKAEFENAIHRRFVDRWNPIIDEMRKAVRIFGIDYRKPAPKSSADALDYFASQKDLVLNYLPDFAIGDIQLLQSRTTSKLERVSTMASIAGYEAYQDLNGDIIFKPPLYNLNCTNFSKKQNDKKSEKNPFIIRLVEVEDEQEQEDENAIRATRITVKGQPWGAILQDFQGEIVPGMVAYTDINLLSKFGMREEPPREITFLKMDNKANLAFAIAEMYRMNRTYRTYRVSIPFRPELKLGFTCYIEHLDMFGYVRNISWTYNVGGNCTMSITLDSLRRRAMLPVLVTTQDKNDPNKKITTYEYRSLSNLVSRFTKKSTTKSATGDNSSTVLASPEGTIQTESGTTEQQANDTSINSVAEDIEKNTQLAFDDYTRFRTIEVKAPDLNQTWRIELDKEGKFTKPRACDEKYLVDLYSTQPYTDDDGYELYGPFPWGRWQTVEDAIRLFTKSLDEQKDPSLNSLESDDRVSNLILTGQGNPIISSIQDALTDIRTGLQEFDITKFTLKEPSNSDVSILDEQDRNPDRVGRTTEDANVAGTVNSIPNIKAKLVSEQGGR